MGAIRKPIQLSEETHARLETLRARLERSYEMGGPCAIDPKENGITHSQLIARLLDVYERLQARKQASQRRRAVARIVKRERAERAELVQLLDQAAGEHVSKVDDASL
jgi:predicted transcriptional regulator